MGSRDLQSSWTEACPGVGGSKGLSPEPGSALTPGECHNGCVRKPYALAVRSVSRRDTVFFCLQYGHKQVRVQFRPFPGGLPRWGRGLWLLPVLLRGGDGAVSLTCVPSPVPSNRRPHPTLDPDPSGVERVWKPPFSNSLLLLPTRASPRACLCPRMLPGTNRFSTKMLTGARGLACRAWHPQISLVVK